MKTIIKILVVLAICFFITTNSLLAQCPPNQVQICHNIGGACVTMCLPPAAVAAHLAHGDYLGTCDGGAIYGLAFDGTQFDLLQFDPATGAVLSTNAPTGATLVGLGTSTFDPVNKRYIFLGDKNPIKHFVVDIATGAVSSFSSSLTGNSEYEFYSCTTSGKKENNPEIGFTEVVTTSPNPISEKTTFSYTIKSDGIVNIEIYDLTGRLVAIPIQQKHHQNGVYQIDWSTGNIPRGVYFYKFTSSTEELYEKIIIIK